jgi:hypothetical protein
MLIGAQANVAFRFVSNGLTLPDVPGSARPRWAKMAEDARRMAGRTRDPEGKRIMLEIANSYDELASWAAKVDAGIVPDC